MRQANRKTTVATRKSVTLVTETLGRSLLSDMATFGFLLLCIWASVRVGSLLWQAIIIVLCLVSLVAKASLMRGDIQYFGSLKEARNWIDKELMEKTLGVKTKPLQTSPPGTAPKTGALILADFGQELLPARWDKTQECWNVAIVQDCDDLADKDNANHHRPFPYVTQSHERLVSWLPMPSIKRNEEGVFNDTT